MREWEFKKSEELMTLFMDVPLLGALSLDIPVFCYDISADMQRCLKNSNQ